MRIYTQYFSLSCKQIELISIEMKRCFAVIIFSLVSLFCYAQCSTVSVQVSASDTTYVQLYQAGFFNIPSGFANICEWEITSFTGEVIYQDTTSGGANEQSTVLFDHMIPLTDSMKVTIFITNEVEGISCTMNDTLYWKETEVVPNAFFGNWEVLSSNGGIEGEISTATETVQTHIQIELFRSPTLGHFEVKSDHDNLAYMILDLNGQVVAKGKIDELQKYVDIAYAPAGLYYVQFLDSNNRRLQIKKIIKI